MENGQVASKGDTAPLPNPPARGSVLVVDDEPTITEVVSRYLQRAGYDTRIAGDGPRALELAGVQRPDLVVLDLMLPGMDGLEVMRRLRQPVGGGDGRMSVILLTAKGEPTDRVIGLRLGADDYVVKPFSPAELVPASTRSCAGWSPSLSWRSRSPSTGSSSTRWAGG